MTVIDAPRLRRAWAEPAGVVSWFATVDHKRIGTRYMATALVFFFLGGLEAAALRAQLARPEERLLSPEAYDQLFSMHGLTMIFLFATPMLSGFGNYFVPLQIGSRDMAFPKLNALGYWIFLGAVHREQLVVRLRREQTLLGARRLRAQRGRFEPAEEEEESEHGRHVARADPLVVDGREPRDDTGRLGPRGRRRGASMTVTAESGRRAGPAAATRSGRWGILLPASGAAVQDPPREVAGRVRHDAGADQPTRGEVGEVRADLAARVRAVDGMAVDARRAEQHLLSALLGGRLRLGEAGSRASHASSRSRSSATTVNTRCAC